ncbi:MAG: hypothetical protein A2X86_17595 [Bdellovibrionales bacterium GWA2_49_15]|nr:MAG: hypothetical protein A2X86_17595 [Bdellovibrionales bacterium GWA2_49_15]HAZ14198.1 hypothetical protein [Bdellovibrionales bacterium]
MRTEKVRKLFTLMVLSGCLYATEAFSGPTLQTELGALVFGGLDFGHTTVNLTPLKYDPEIEDSPTLTLDQYEEGFRVTHGLAVDLGVGPGVSFYFADASGLAAYLGLFVGVAVVAEKNVEFTSLVENKDEIKAVTKHKKIPWKASEIAGWREGETVFYQTNGGIALSARLGNWYLGVGPTVVLAGGWQTYIEKMEDGKVFVQLMKAQEKELRLVAGTLVAEAYTSVVNELAKGVSFAFDLTDEEALHAYEDFLKGNIVPAEQMASQVGTGGVVRVDNILRSKRRHVKKFAVGIPFIYFTWTKENYREYFRKESSLDGVTRELYFGANLKQTVGRAITVHRTTNEGFYSALEVDSRTDQAKSDEENKLDYSGKYNWFYAADHGSSKQLNRALRRLVKATGLTSELSVNVPDAKKLKYTALSYEFDLPRAYVDYLLADDHFVQVVDQYGDLAAQGLEDYFADKSDPWGLCLTKLNLDNCKARLLLSRRVQVKKMHAALEEMKAAAGDLSFAVESDRTRFIKAFSEFGNALVSDVFLFQAAYKDAQKCGMKTSYRIEGERLSRLVSDHSWPLEDSCK